MTHKHEAIYWRLAANEDGWMCSCGRYPGEPVGFDPVADKEQIAVKVHSILSELHEKEFIYIANGSEGDILETMVANRCRNENRFDQYSIIRFIMDLEAPSHADYWRKITMSIRDGRDPRDRCQLCNKLAKQWCGKDKFCADCGRTN